MARRARERDVTDRFIGFAPFLVTGLLGWATLALPHPQAPRIGLLLAAAALTALTIAVATLVALRRLPDSMQLLAALSWLVGVSLMREGAGGVGSGYSALYLLGVLWPALYGGRRQLGIMLTAYAAVQMWWIVAHQNLNQLTYAVLSTAVTIMVCVTVQHLVRQVRAQNSALRVINRVSDTLAMEGDLATARNALCEVATEVCRADLALIYELDADERLTVTAAHHRDGSPVPECWSGTAVLAEEALRTGEQHFVTGLAEDGREQLSPTLLSGVWQPVLRAGRPIGVVAVAWRDAQRRLSSDVRVALPHLAEQTGVVIERTALLARREQQVAELRELDRLKTDFVSSASHELRTPITSVRGYLDVLMEGEAGPMTDEQRSFLQVADRNARRLQTLVEDLLVVSRIESGRLQLSVHDFDLVAVVRRVAQSLGPQLNQSEVTLELELPEALTFQADERRIEQVLVNLLSNAIKFSPDGGEVTVRVATPPDVVRVTVADHGIGMPEKDVRRLFEKFFRSETATERSIPGSGLGLAICQGIIEAHGGTVAVRSTVGEGTTFTVDLPRVTRR